MRAGMRNCACRSGRCTVPTKLSTAAHGSRESWWRKACPAAAAASRDSCGLITWWVDPNGASASVQPTAGMPGPFAPQRLLHSAPPTRPDHVWVTDLTYVLMLTGWVHLAGVMDLCTRRIVGWALAPKLETALVLGALNQAVQRRKPLAGLIVHSDRGLQVASAQFRQRLADHQLLASMSRRANCYDNAAMESFWSTLKMECVFRSRFPTARAVHQTLFRYIESFYNSRRLHSALGYNSPLDFESLLT